MSNESPWGDAEVSVTLKQHKGHESPWIVVRGGSVGAVKAAVEEVTGLDGEGLTLAELVYNSADSFQRISTVAHNLDATIIPNDTPDDQPAPQAKAEAPAAAPEPAAEVDHTKAIGDIKTKAGLTDYYLKHKSAFDGDSDLLGALQGRFTASDVA